MSQQKLSIDDIKALAAEVRLIKDFSENRNFNSGLINASVSPAEKAKSETDWPLITAFGAAFLLIIALVIYNFAGELNQKAITAFFVVCLLLGGIATMAVHKRFENLTLTLIAGGVLLSAILIGCGIFTPQEAVSEAKSYIHNKNDTEKK